MSSAFLMTHLTGQKQKHTGERHNGRVFYSLAYLLFDHIYFHLLCRSQILELGCVFHPLRIFLASDLDLPFLADGKKAVSKQLIFFVQKHNRRFFQ